MNLGAFSFPFAASLQTQLDQTLDKTIVTPAERIAQYGLLGAGIGLGLAMVVGLASELVPRKSRWGVLGLIAVPAVGAAAGIVLGGKASQP